MTPGLSIFIENWNTSQMKIELLPVLYLENINFKIHSNSFLKTLFRIWKNRFNEHTITPRHRFYQCPLNFVWAHTLSNEKPFFSRTFVAFMYLWINCTHFYIFRSYFCLKIGYYRDARVLFFFFEKTEKERKNDNLNAFWGIFLFQQKTQWDLVPLIELSWRRK